eukprot:12887834-Prorocentrum_lima.AAC.1
MSAAAASVSEDDMRALIKAAVTEVPAENGKSLLQLTQDVKDLYTTVAANQEDTNALKDRI